jgi:hydroxymethylpyrimidine/phosphomethylpyrimidine kinase
VTPFVALTVAGSDSGGGAGLQADLRTFAAWGVHGTVAVTAVTAQSTTQVAGVMPLPAAFVALQVRTVADDLAIRAAKTGMLATAATVAAVADLAAEGLLPDLVVDPVLVSSTGHLLMEEAGVDAYRRLLLPRALVVTPNLREAAVLTGRRPESLASEEAMAQAAEEIRGLGPRLVVVKGGHAAVAGAPDVVAGPDGVTVLPGTRVDTPNDHGTGCSLSAAVAAQLALGVDPLVAIAEAKAFVHRALVGAAGWRLGAGHGPIDHLGWESPGRPGRPGPRP